MKQEISNLIKGVFLDCNYDVDNIIISKANNRDVCDFQCNDIFKFAKKFGVSPISLGENIVAKINELPDFSLYFSSVVFVAPGFINIKISSCLINKYMRFLYDDPKQILPSYNETFVIDYGGPNVAKPLHVGHMRTAIVGESIKRIIRYMGNTVISDVHLGDFGLQIGEVIYAVIRDNVGIDDIDIKYLDKTYPEMNALVKENDDIKEECALITKELQDGNLEYQRLWKRILEVSKADINNNYKFLGVSFDYWYGESDAYSYLPKTESILGDKGLLMESNGALVVDVSDEHDKKEIPPLLFRKSNGAYLYASTDVATILQRKLDFSPDHILYVVDNRQEMHFTQVFRTVSKAGIMDMSQLEFLGYGTVNGSDNKPYKTRSGNTPKLEMLFDEARNLFVSKKETNKDMSQDDVNIIVNAILKFADLSNSRSKDYIFDLSKFSEVTGKTGPYILYTYLRINKILCQFGINNVLSDNIYNKSDRDLRLRLLEFSDALISAYNERMPHYIADYVYNLCVSANIFYQNNHILNMDDCVNQNDWLYILTITNKIIKQMLELLVIDIPTIM
ncbi:MAG: arginine--tRNA ligase [Bacilli bacterium]|nr:arginine--tRNA ligase [Bacilli bacterium]